LFKVILYSVADAAFFVQSHILG